MLFEHASGYALFRVKEYEEISMFVPQVERATLDAVKFKSLVKLIAFSPFKSGPNALDNINSISEGILHEDLQLFLETFMPKPGKKEKIILGVSDAKIGAAIQEVMKINCQFTDAIPEILRGIRLHFHVLVKKLTSQMVGSAECSLGRSYSRAKVKFNVNRADNMVIQSISLIDQLDKDINTFAMRLREWYSYHFPELVKIVNDNYMYAKVAKLIGNRKEISDEEELTEEIEKESDNKEEYILDNKEFYRELRIRGYDYGPKFQSVIESKFIDLHKVHGKIKWTNNSNVIAFLDSMLQLIISVIPIRALFVPVAIQSLRCDPKVLFQAIEDHKIDVIETCQNKENELDETIEGISSSAKALDDQYKDDFEEIKTAFENDFDKFQERTGGGKEKWIFITAI